MAARMNWDREGRRARLERSLAQTTPVDINIAYQTLSFYLRERDVNTRYVISIPYEWESMSVEQLTPYFKAHRSGTCKSLRALKDANWCRISVATAESVGMVECELCNPYRNRQDT